MYIYRNTQVSTNHDHHPIPLPTQPYNESTSSYNTLHNQGRLPYPRTRGTHSRTTERLLNMSGAACHWSHFTTVSSRQHSTSSFRANHRVLFSRVSRSHCPMRPRLRPHVSDHVVHDFFIESVSGMQHGPLLSETRSPRFALPYTSYAPPVRQLCAIRTA
jgi:hypothetical protein